MNNVELLNVIYEMSIGFIPVVVADDWNKRLEVSTLFSGGPPFMHINLTM
jgi:hypothetical protein